MSDFELMILDASMSAKRQHKHLYKLFCSAGYEGVAAFDRAAILVAFDY